MKGLDLSKFKKISADKNSTVLKHADGHELKIAHNGLSAKMKANLDKLPLHQASGGMINSSNQKAALKENYKGKKKVQYFADGGDSSPVPTGNDVQDRANYEATNKQYMDQQAQTQQDAQKASQDAAGRVAYEQKLAQWNGGLGNSAPQIQGQSQDQAPATPDQGVAANGTPNALMTNDQQAQANAPDPTTPDQSAPGASQSPAPQDASSAPTPTAPTSSAAGPSQDTPAPTAQDYSQDFKKEDAAWQQDLQNGHITPETYQSLFAKKDTLGKIGTIFGLMLGGVGGGLTHQPNAALAMMQNEIEKDFEAQKSSKDNAMNFLRLNNEHQLQQAQIQSLTLDQKMKSDAMARMQANRVALHSLVQKVNSLPVGSPQRQAAEQQLSFMSQQVDAANGNLADRTAGAMANYNMLYGNQDQSDPASKVRLRVPEPQQKAVFEEIKNAQDTKAIAPKILDAFDHAANEKHFVDIVPGVQNADQKNFLGLINTTVKEQEGTARQAAFKSIEDNMMPQAFDDKNTLNRKRQLVQDYLTSHASAPTAKGYGINLENYQSTNPKDIQAPKQPQKVVQNGHTYTLNPKTGKYE